MCGICGLAYPSPLGGQWTEAQLVRMRDTLHHRGPDDAGLFGDPFVGLAQRRLSIVDVASGHQPMISADGRFVIIYNGEVYNHPALKAELERDGVEFRTRCDTETVLHLFERHGPAFVDRLRGMFAIAIWDRQTRELLLVRDRLGVKPLYYHQRADGTLVFGSEIKAILASGLVSARMNLAAMPDLLANHAPSGTETLYAGIQRLPAGHVLRWREGEITLSRYWDVPLPTAATARPDADLVAEYGERLEEAVRLRLMADVPLGAFLSGGIDSAAIVAIMARLAGERVKTFLRRLRGARGERAGIRAPRRRAIRHRPPRGAAEPRPVLAPPAPVALARGRADRAPVEHRPECGVAAGGGAREGRAHRRRQR